MSPASWSKVKDKKATKEAHKACATAKSTGSGGSAAAGIPASVYNPFSPIHSNGHSNGRFRNIDETDKHPGSSVVAGVEYDSVSNNGSWSGKSEDHKEKISNPPVRLESVPGADNDKREKICQKNAGKHQRQKERRAQERCRSYLMSKKVEKLAQQFVGFGFSYERATKALVLNEGRLEESVAWLFENCKVADGQNDKTMGRGNLNIDISEELARIADMEIRYGCSKQEVERVIVSCEGDLEKAAEILSGSKHDPPSAPPKPEENGDHPIINNVKQVGVSSQNPRSQIKPVLSPNQPKIDDKDFNYTKAPITNGVSSESGNKIMQPLTRMRPKSEWVKPPQQATIPSDKRWPEAGSNPPISFSLASPMQVPPSPAKTEARYVSVGEHKILQLGVAEEPIVVMPRPQTEVPATSISSQSPGISASWYPINRVEAMRSNVCTPQAPRSYEVICECGRHMLLNISSSNS